MNEFYEIDGFNIVNINEIAMLEINKINTNTDLMQAKITLKSGVVYTKEFNSYEIDCKYFINLREVLLGNGVNKQ